ncbi:integrase core domain-containing protein [Terricaulis silvestris]|nr:integrase core domain-containing protein [Terricaulis silvestris]
MAWGIAFGFACGLLVRSLWVSGLRASILHAHREAFRLWWRWRSRHKGGRPRIDPALIALIRRMSLENPLWGAPRLHGELLKLGFRLSQSTVSKYMIPRKGRPAQSWITFLRNHASAIAAIDMLTVRTFAFECLYAFVVLSHDRRRILRIEVTTHPTALWLASQVAQVLGAGSGVRVLVRDNDGAYGAAFRDQVRALGLDDRPTRPGSPWQNGHVERLIGSIRRECLDHQIIFNAAHLRRVLGAYAAYYNDDRTHLALAKDAPETRAVEAHGRIVSRRVLGGLHRRYFRIRSK